MGEIEGDGVGFKYIRMTLLVPLMEELDVSAADIVCIKGLAVWSEKVKYFTPASPEVKV